MDRVRFGRALGKGARAAARAAVEAMDAASTPSPALTSTASSNRPVTTVRPAAAHTAVVGEVLRARPAVSRAARQAAGGMLAPVRTASRALWHELTGSFFALFALSFAGGVWHTRATAVSPLPSDRHRFYAFCILALVFAYFAVSSFLRARKRPTA